MLPKVVETGAKNAKSTAGRNYFAHDQFVPKVTRPNQSAIGEPTRTREKMEMQTAFRIIQFGGTSQK